MAPKTNIPPRMLNPNNKYNAPEYVYIKCRASHGDSLYVFSTSIGKERNRKQTENVKNWTSFRKEYYRDHHELNHGTRWAEYQHLNMADKEGYFTDKTR